LPDRITKFAAISGGERLRQGEIVSGLIQIRQSLETVGMQRPPRLDEVLHPFAIVMTQDCDLESDFRLQSEGAEAKLQLLNILFCEAVATNELKARVPPGKDIWKRVVQNKDERYQCLEAIPSNQDVMAQGVPCLGCDFKRFFTIPSDEVYRRIELQQISRRARLLTPFAEHLLSRFCTFQARVPLPENHDVPM
jgi:hypothetical protein